MLDQQNKTPQEIAARLDISPSTLRRWSDEFTDFLSSQANTSGKSHRRYTEEDLSILSTVKTLMNDGLTYEQVRQRLLQRPAEPENLQTSVILSPDETTMAGLTYFSEAINELHQGQLSVLNSQAANRELMGVLIQDNFNLKEENSRLRTRILDVERQVSQLRRDEAAQQETMRQEIEAKLMEVRELAASKNPITILQSRSGCLGSLFGGGGQIQAVHTPPAAPQTPPPATQQPAYPASASRPFPRPPGPPE